MQGPFGEVGKLFSQGWFTVGSYFACAILSFILTFTNQHADRRSFLFWSMIGLLMVILGINKQLDLQSLFTEVGRQVARNRPRGR